MKQRTNVLWIFSDEHRGFAMGCAGDPNIETPNLDRLEREGVRFQHAYSNTPVCTPARGCIYTGQYITTHGARANHYPLLPGRSPQMAEVMRDAGYRTSHYGKWHLSGGSVCQHFVSPFFRPGWEEWIGWECMHGGTGAGTYYDTRYGEGHRRIQPNKIDKFQADWLTDRTIEQIERRAGGDVPWFHVVSIETPHPPVTAPDNVSMPHYQLFQGRHFEHRPNVPEDRREQTEEFLRGYYSHIANIDENVGRILGVLENTDQLENTIVFYFSDHGDFAGSHGNKCGKNSPLEESARIPLLVRLPSSLETPRRTGTHTHTSDAFISLVDLMPTTLGLCGVSAPASCEGSDLSALVRGDTDDGPDTIYMQYENSYFIERFPRMVWRAIRHGDWKYHMNLEDGPSELFNLAEDPYEMHNRINDMTCAAAREELHQRMERRARELGDDFFERLTVRQPMVQSIRRESGTRLPDSDTRSRAAGTPTETGR
jgi:arylsulfatase A-like enzyme